MLNGVPLLSRTFQSTHPVRGGTAVDAAVGKSPEISIHPPREGWDFLPSLIVYIVSHFNPPTP